MPLNQEINYSGVVRYITEDDILIVTPYNVQVNYLRSILPKNARVGTVDNFQGQEAPIVLVFMVTSSAECLPTLLHKYLILLFTYFLGDTDRFRHS
ncbi:MAG: hypothetical protein K2P53_01365 [Rickettsiales bacterium]|nr:hypothetical protein [Rickettsiales bacterium]